MGTSISTPRIATYHGYHGHLLPAPADSNGDIEDLYEADSNGDIEDLYEADSNGDIEDLYEAEPLTLKTQKRDNDAQWLDNYLDNYSTPWMDRDNYDSNVDWADARQDFNPQFVGKQKGK